jgi:hypothetical protein
MTGKKIPTFKSIGVKFSGDTERYIVSSSRPKVSTTYIKDVVEEMLLPRIKLVKAGGKYTGGMHSQDNLWYNALPLFNKYDVKYSNDSREGFKTCIRDLCKEHGVAREQIGLYASPWGAMYFRGQWHDISFDSIKELAAKGCDIIFIEKRDVVQSLGKYADKWGIALINTHGHMSKYTEDLAELANITGANIALLTDYDVPGILIASKLPETVPRLGIDETTLDNFEINDKEDTTMVIPYIPKISRIDAITFHMMIQRDKRFNKGKIDTGFLNRQKIEIDAVIAKVGEEKFWNYLLMKLGKEFKTRNYLRVIDPRPALTKHYPEIVKKLNLLIESHANNITEEESQKIAKELEKVKGFIEVEKKEKEILDDRLGKILQQDEIMNDIADSIEQADQDNDFGLSNIEIPPEPEPEEEEQEPEQAMSFTLEPSEKLSTQEEDIPDPPPLEHMDDEIRRLILRTGMNEALFTKYHAISEYGSSEIRQELVELEHNDEWGEGEWNEDEEELEDYEDRVEKARISCINVLYWKVMRQFKREHNQRLPWEETGGQRIETK